MDDVELRLECMRLAISLVSFQAGAVSMQADAIGLAEKIRRFVEGKSAGADDQPQPGKVSPPEGAS